MVKYTFLLLLLFGEMAVANAQLLVDPTEPFNYRRKAELAVSQQRRAVPKLQTIIANNSQRKAIINKKLYSVGEQVNGYRITAIEKDAVTVEYQSRSYRLTLYASKERFIE